MAWMFLAIDSKVFSGGDDGVFHQEKGHPTSLAGVGNQGRLHVAHENCGTLIFQAQEKGGLVGEDRAISRHEIHCLFVFSRDVLRNGPFRDHSTDLNGGEILACFGTFFDVQSALPEVKIVGQVSIGSFDKFGLIFWIQHGDFLVPQHDGKEEEAGFVIDQV